MLVFADGCLFPVDDIAHQGPQLSGILVVAGGPVYLLTSVLSPQPRLLSQLLGQLAKYFQMVHFHDADLVEYGADIGIVSGNQMVEDLEGYGGHL